MLAVLMNVGFAGSNGAVVATPVSASGRLILIGVGCLAMAMIGVTLV